MGRFGVAPRGDEDVDDLPELVEDSRSLGVGTGREALSQKLRLHRRVRGSSFGNGLEVGVLLPGYRASVLPIG